MKAERRVKVCFPLQQDKSGYPPASSEILWCIPKEKGRYLVDGIPFFVRDVSLDDEISAEKVRTVLQFSHVLRKSKSSTVRVLLKKRKRAKMIRATLNDFGCLTELMDEMDLLAASMPPNAQIADALSFLDEEAAQGNIGIEESAVRYQ